MTDTNYIPLSSLPGICLVDSAYLSSQESSATHEHAVFGRYTDMENARFTAGMPEKLGGWTLATASQFDGVPRGINQWRDNSQIAYIGVGTTTKLYYLSPAGTVTTPQNITPWRAIRTGTLTDPLTTSNGSADVSVAHTSHGLKVGEYFKLTAATTLDGVTVAGTYFVKTVTDANNYIFDSGQTATGSTSGGGGATNYVYYSIVLTNPFSTVSGSPIVTVAHTANDAVQGDTVYITGGSAVGGLTLSGAYTIDNVSTNSYTITASSNASSTVSGGGGSPYMQYEISVGLSTSADAFGYGTGGYGTDDGSGYGGTSSTGLVFPARTWALDHYGQQLIASPYGGTIYIWDPTLGGRAYPLYGAPDSCTWMFVTNERFVFALGTDGNYMQIKWPDQTDYTDWTPTAENTANIRTLQKGSYMVGGIVARDGVALLFSNLAAYLATYTGDNFVYDTTTTGTQCGLTGPLACCMFGGVVYWLGINDFWSWNGAVIPLPSDDVRDYVFTTKGGNPGINLAQAQKFVAGVNSQKNEIWFFYCSAAATEIDSFAIYHIDQQCFSVGSCSNSDTGLMTPRTGWLDRELFSYPLATDINGFLFNHESGVDANGSAMTSYIEFSPMVMDRANRRMDINGFKPDFKRLTGSIDFYTLTQDYPESSVTTNGPNTITAGSTTLVDLRDGATMAGFKLTSQSVGADWRLGLCSVDAQPAGARR